MNGLRTILSKGYLDLRVTNYDLRIERVRLTPMLMCAKVSGNEWAACYPEQGIFGEMCLF